MLTSRSNRIASSRSDFLAQKYPKVPSSTIEEMEQADPSRGKALEWLVRQVNNSAIRWPEDASRATEALQTFFTLKRSPNLLKQYSVSPDLNSYNFHSLEEIHRKVHGTENRQSLLSEIPKGAEKVYDNGKYAVVKVTTPEAASALADSTSWCTRHLGTASSYLEDGPLYVFFQNGKKFAQADSEGQFMDINDSPILVKDRGLLEIFYRIVGSVPDNTHVRSSFVEESLLKSFASNDYTNINKYMKNIGNEPVPILEPILMKHSKLASVYAVKVKKSRWLEAEPYIMSHLKDALYYKNFLVRGEWPELEEKVLSNPNSIVYYSEESIKGPWQKGMDALLQHYQKNPTREVVNQIAEYCLKVLRNKRWPEAEAILINWPELAEQYLVNYCRDNIQGRWPELEKKIVNEPSASYRYAAQVLKGRWPEAERAILENYSFIYSYAQSVLNHRWPEGEKYLEECQSPLTVMSYIRVFNLGRWPAVEPVLKKNYFVWEDYLKRLPSHVREELES